MLTFTVHGSDDGGFRFVNKSFKAATSGDIADATALFTTDWPTDTHGDKKAALIRVKFRNIPLSEVKNISFDFDDDAPTETIKPYDDKYLLKKNELGIYLNPFKATKTNAVMLCATHPIWGKAYCPIDITVAEKKIYEVELELDRSVTVTIHTKPSSGVVAFIDGSQVEGQSSPFRRQGVTLGRHKIEVSQQGELKTDTIVEVSDVNTDFRFDLRDRKEVGIDSDPQGALVQIIEGTEQIASLKTPGSIILPYGAYTLIGSKDGINDTTAVDINYYTKPIKLYIVKRNYVELYATINGKVNSSFITDIRCKEEGRSIPELNSYKNQSAERHKLHLPFGEYNATLSCGNSWGERSFIVGKKMKSYRFTLTEKGPSWWRKVHEQFDGDENAQRLRFLIGYVRKQSALKISEDGGTIRWNGYYEEDLGKWMDGVQIGFRGQPYFRNVGLGLHTGIFYELYLILKNNDYRDYTILEHNLYMPLHAFYLLPLGPHVAISANCGLGVNWSISAKGYGNDGYTTGELLKSSGRFQSTLELAGGLNLGPVQINATFSRGFDYHKLLNIRNDGRTRPTINKMSFSLSFAM